MENLEIFLLPSIFFFFKCRASVMVNTGVYVCVKDMRPRHTVG